MIVCEAMVDIAKVFKSCGMCSLIWPADLSIYDKINHHAWQILYSYIYCLHDRKEQL